MCRVGRVCRLWDWCKYRDEVSFGVMCSGLLIWEGRLCWNCGDEGVGLGEVYNVWENVIVVGESRRWEVREGWVSDVVRVGDGLYVEVRLKDEKELKEEGKRMLEYVKRWYRLDDV